jgi:hypothetical protein
LNLSHSGLLQPTTTHQLIFDFQGHMQIAKGSMG